MGQMGPRCRAAAGRWDEISPNPFDMGKYFAGSLGGRTFAPPSERDQTPSVSGAP